jgi:hypothetical protein
MRKRMKKYKVYGDKLIEFYTVVTADSQEQAWEFAANNNSIDWFQIENDRTIEPYHIQEELEETETNLLEDGYPSMANDILIMDKTDI